MASDALAASGAFFLYTVRRLGTHGGPDLWDLGS